MKGVGQFELLNIKGDCFDILISSFVASIKGEYRFLYSKCCGLVHNPNHYRIGERLQLCKGDIIESAINNGVKIDFYKYINCYQLISLIYKYNPLIIEMDGYYCFWRNTYKKVHRYHYILLSEYITKIQQFICMDIFPTNDKLQLDLEFVLKYSIRVICISEYIEGYKLLSAEEYLMPIISNCYLDNNPNSIQYLREYIDDLPRIIDLKQELLGYEDVNIVYCPIVWNYKSIIWSLYELLYLLDFISRDEMRHFINCVKKLIEYFEIITNQIIIRIIRKEYQFLTDKMKTYLEEALYYQETLVDDLRLFCDK